MLASLLTATRVEPGQAVDGVFKLYAEDLLPQQPLRIEVLIEKERHAFDFEVADN